MEQNKENLLLEPQNTNDKITDVTSRKLLNKVDLNNKKTLRNIALLVVGFVIVAFVFFNFQGKTDIGSGYELTSQKIEIIDGSPALTGVAKNTCGNIETFMITWDLYDSSHSTIGTAISIVENINDGESKEFKGILLPADGSPLNDQEFAKQVSSFELDEVLFMKAENQRPSRELDNYRSWD